RRERRGLARTLESLAAARRPGERAALAVGDGDDRVVERCMHVRDAVGDVLANLLAHALRGGVGCSSHVDLLSKCPDPAQRLTMAPERGGPLRVRALVLVRWPRTGSPRRCRKPR